VRPVAVVVVGVPGQHRPQVPASEYQHPVRQPTPDAAHPSLRVGVRPWRPHRRGQHVDRLGGEDRVERAGELRIPIAEHEPEPTDPLLKAHEQVAGLLGHPLLWGAEILIHQAATS